MESLAALLSGLVSGTLTVPVVSWILNQLPETVTKTQKRLIALVVSFALGTGAFALSGYFNYLPMPAATVQAWLEALWPVWVASFTASQIVLSTFKSLK